MGSGETYSNDIGEETTMNTDGQLPEVKKINTFTRPELQRPELKRI